MIPTAPLLISRQLVIHERLMRSYLYVISVADNSRRGIFHSIVNHPYPDTVAGIIGTVCYNEPVDTWQADKRDEQRVIGVAHGGSCGIFAARLVKALPDSRGPSRPPRVR